MITPSIFSRDHKLFSYPCEVDIDAECIASAFAIPTEKVSASFVSLDIMQREIFKRIPPKICFIVSSSEH
jgi:hypothetical protein